MNNFCFKISFSQAQHAISDFCFFFSKGRCFFMRRSFLICFHRNLLSIFTRNETFCERKGLLDCSRFSALCDLREIFIKIFFSKNSENISLIFCFFFYIKKCFRLKKRWVFAVSSRGRIVFEMAL